MKINLQQPKYINFNTTSIRAAINQSVMIGAAWALKAKSKSEPLLSKDEVYVIVVKAFTEAPVQKNNILQQAAALMQIQPRVDYEVYEALKTNANIEEHLFKFY